MNITTKSLLIVATSAFGVSANAAVLSFDSAKVSQITDLSQMKYTGNAYQDNVKMRVWNEKQGHTLSANVKVDAIAAGTYDSYADLGNHSITAGTKVDSHMLYWDPKKSVDMITTIRFETPILGVIAHSDRAGDDRFLSSDSELVLAGVPSANLPSSSFANRGIEMRNLNNSAALQDWFSISSDRMSLFVDLRAGSPGDQLRVVTEPVPEPASMAIIGVGLLGLMRKRRKA